MNGIVARIRASVSSRCQVSRCRGDGCEVSMKDAPTSRVVINLDCAELQLGGGPRCDYVAAFDYSHATRIATIELKSGSFRATDVVRQLQGGARFAESSLPAVDAKHFVPVLARGKRVHAAQMRELRRQHIEYRGTLHQIVLIRCGGKMVDAFGP